jgi:hypothetical protein
MTGGLMMPLFGKIKVSISWRKKTNESFNGLQLEMQSLKQ